MAAVAELACVSLSTVGRVINERGSVSDSKRRKVLEAARTLGLKRLLPSPLHGLLRFDLLIVDSHTDHFQKLSNAFSRQAQIHRSRLVIQRLTWCENKPDQLLDFIANPKTPRQGLIVVAHDTPLIRSALQAEIDKGVAIVLLTSSLSGLEGATYVGINNRVAGRCAGRLLSRWAGHPTGQVLLLTNSLLFHAHQERVNGFLEVLRDTAPEMVVSDPFQCFDDNDRAALAVKEVLASGKKIAAIYNTGGGSTGIYQALLQYDLRPVWIGHEASLEHAQIMRKGLLSVVVDQDADGQAEAAIQHLLFVSGDIEEPVNVNLQLRIVIDENLPA
ncbi:LacI family DNA-binding transcriptional regulator [Pseudomonas sp. NPDC087804]|uniref:LacI family DNA-binding transcriptional regulator n=1 Tax=Pseudomonas sp. NPDC087804 TaxID=3364449 RepID=UPI0037FBE2B7